jgi:predicted transcriptional regulator
MKVKEVMQQEFIPIEGERSIQTAEKIMEQSGIDIMPVVMGKNIMGMITNRDINTNIFARGLDPKNAKISNGMTEKLFACGEDDRIETAARKMKRCRARHLLVMNRDRQLVGLVSIDDIKENIHRQH